MKGEKKVDPRGPEKFRLIFVLTFMKPQMVTSFLAKNISETAKIIKKLMKRGHKKKCLVSL